jgi:hypothetical protein
MIQQLIQKYQLASYDVVGINATLSLTPGSRGCYWNKCTFCGLNEGERKYRLKSFDKAINEINYYLVKYDCDLWMTDSIIPRSYIKNVLPFLRIPEGRSLAYEVRADYDEEEMYGQPHQFIFNTGFFW